MLQAPSLNTHRNRDNLGDQAVLQKVSKPWNMEPRLRSNPSVPVNCDPRNSFVFNKAIKSCPTKIAQIMEQSRFFPIADSGKKPAGQRDKRLKPLSAMACLYQTFVASGTSRVLKNTLTCVWDTGTVGHGTKIADKKIAKTAEQASKYGFSNNGRHLNDLRLCLSICGKALLFRSSPKKALVFAAVPEAEPPTSLVTKTVKQSFTVSRTAEPSWSASRSPTKFARTAEQTCKTLGLSILMVCFFLIRSVFAQEKPKAIQIDEFGTIGCEYLYAKSDNLQTVLKQNPSATGVVILHPQASSLAKALRYKNFIEKIFQKNEYAYDRLKIVRGPAAALVGGEFWLVPPNADDPSRGMDLWTDETLDLSKPFLYDSEDENGICPTFVPKLYAALIKANPDVLGRIVVIPNSNFGKRRKFEAGKEWTDTLTNKYGIRRNRLRLVFAKDSNFEIVQFWIVPIKRR